MYQGARPCPGRDTLAAVITGELNANELAAVGVHLDQCAHCRDRVVALALAAPAPQAPRRLARGTARPLAREPEPIRIGWAAMTLAVVAGTVAAVMVVWI